MQLKGYCPVQDKEVTIHAKDICSDEIAHSNKALVGRIDCDFIRHLGNCNYAKCPILEQNGLKN